jgi:hypothetical protein
VGLGAWWDSHSDLLPVPQWWVHFLTSLALTCARNIPTRGCELQGERPRTLQADRVRLSA